MKIPIRTVVIVVPMNIMPLEETVAFGSIVDKNRLETGFDSGNNPFVNIAMGDFP
jgi:hypothetical protein